MTIKELWEKIKNVFSKKDTKELPDGETAIVQANGEKGMKRKEFSDELRVPEANEPIDMEADYKKAIEDFNKLVDEENTLKMRIMLRIDGIAFDENDDYKQLSERYEKKIEDEEAERYPSSEEANEKNMRIKIRKEAVIASIKDGTEITEYLENAFALYVEAEQKKATGQPVVMSEEQKQQIADIENYLRIISAQAPLLGRIAGMQEAAYKETLTTDEKTKKIQEIKDGIELAHKIMAVSGVEAAEKGLEPEDGITKMDEVMFQVDKAEEYFDYLLYREVEKTFHETSERYSRYLHEGGTPPSLDVFEDYQMKGTIAERRMSDKDIKALSSRYEELKEQGRLPDGDKKKQDDAR